MFQKAHLYLTAMCAGITAAILLAMSLFYLYVSEKGLYESQSRSFQNDVRAIAASLEQSSLISMEWLSKMEAGGGYSFYIIDNGVPFLYNRLKTLPQEESYSLMEACIAAYEQSPAYRRIQEELAAGGRYRACSYVAFSFQTAGKKRYDAGVIELGGRQGERTSLRVLALSPRQALEEQIQRQRLRFLAIDGAALLLLALFSFFFTGFVLSPIEGSRRRQNAFVAAASHELRTPLAVILSAAECCLDAPRERQERFLATIRQEGKTLTSLVNDMLELTAQDSHSLPLRPAPTELDTLCMEAYEAFEPLALEKGIGLAVTLPEESLPPCLADRERLWQLLSILLENAISYTPAGGQIWLSLSLLSGQGRKRFCIRVSDSGIGISRQEREKIFHRFYRVDKSRSGKGHFGLGLSIAAEIVRLHRGKITVEEREGGGSVFAVTLP